MLPGSNNNAQYLEEKVRRKLAELKIKAEEDRAQALAKQLDLPYANLFFTAIDPEALKNIEENAAREAGLAVIYNMEKSVRIAIKDPRDERAKTVIKKFEDEGNLVSVFVVSARSLEKAYSFYERGILHEKVTGATTVNTQKFKDYGEKIKKMADIPPLLNKVAIDGTADTLEFILGAALALDASDIHIESGEEHGKLRFRVDGLLYDSGFLSMKLTKALILRIKLISGLKINVTEEPQDGRFSIKLEHLSVEIRTSVLPGPYGENIVMRVLHPKAISVTLAQLGFQEWDLKTITAEIEKPNGMIMITGPTGSGKTTTLYAIMHRLNQPNIKIITLEDPVEYHVEGLEQIEIDPERGLSFATGLRSMLRQDPDIILVGELRDYDTTETAIHAALTGHLVLTTMHTNDSSGTIPRLIDIGVKSNIIAPAVNLSMSQRLVRKICASCAKKTPATPEELSLIRKECSDLPEKVDKTKFPPLDETLMLPKKQGCEKCNHTGYKGRIAVFELLVMDTEMREFILTSPSQEQLKRKASEKGVVTMRQDGILKVLQGITDVDEIFRVLGKMDL